MRRIEGLGLVSALALMMAPTHAGACTVSATGVAFGTYDTLSAAPDDSAGAVLVECHPSEHVPTVAISTGGSGSFADRRMSGGADSLAYNLYTSAARNLVWGDGSAGTAIVTLVGGIVNAGRRRFNQPIYGRIPARQAVDAGTYSDTLFVTLSF